LSAPRGQIALDRLHGYIERAYTVNAVAVTLAVNTALLAENASGVRHLGTTMVVAVALSIVLGPLPTVLQEVRTRRRGTVMPLDSAAAWAELGFGFVAMCAVSIYTGGIAHDYWVAFMLVGVAASIRLSLKGALVISGACAVAIAATSAMAGSLTADRAGALVLACTLVASVSGFVSIGMHVTRQLHARSALEAEQLAEGVERLSQRFVSTASGDLGATSSASPVDHPSLTSLDAAFNETLASLRSLVGQIRTSGEQIAAAAAELLATAEDHAASASQQSSAVSETTSTIEELAATAAQIAETSETVAGYAAETLQHAEQGRTAVMASVSSMDVIAERVDSIAARALSLGEKSQEIGAILEVIDVLADQTNLLALNAAIEAARAGEHGRGFSVVATEVRALAERAQEATGRIKAIVDKIQAETNATIIASEEGAKEAGQGTELARGVVRALERISGMVDETTSAAKEISIATQQQRSASDQVVGAMNQVSDVARQYAVGSRQSAAAAAQLDRLAAELRGSISQFSG
jgi:methyl-accepting chemotaxis protein